jgi:hypothetical protein
MPKLKELERSLAALEESDEERAREGDSMFTEKWRHN